MKKRLNLIECRFEEDLRNHRCEIDINKPDLK